MSVGNVILFDYTINTTTKPTTQLRGIIDNKTNSSQSATTSRSAVSQRSDYVPTLLIHSPLNQYLRGWHILEYPETQSDLNGVLGSESNLYV